MIAVGSSGVDTWSPAWYVDPSSHTASALDELASVAVSRGRALPERIAGYRVGWMRGQRLMWVEGHPDRAGLGCPDELPGELDRIAAALDDYGLPAPAGRKFEAWDGGTLDDRAGFAGVRRLDATVNFECSSGAEGLAVLHGVAAVAREAPRVHAEVRYGSSRRLETVYFRGYTGAKVLGRWYDKGVEALSAPPGQLVRAEDQRRFVKATRRDVDELTSAYVREKFQQRFAPLWQASKGVKVAGPFKAAEFFAQKVANDELTAAQAERLLGHVLLGDLVSRPARTRRRQAAEVRKTGFVLADGVLEEVEVDLHDVLTRALDTDAWERRG